MNARSGIPPPMASAKHKPSSCNALRPIRHATDRSLIHAVPEPATKVRRTLAERAGDLATRKPTAPPSTRPLSTSVKNTVTRKERGFSASTSTSRAGARPASRSATASSFSASMGPAAGPKPTRPRSAYGQYTGPGTGTHVRSKSHTSAARPATSLYRRDAEDDDEEEERGVQPFLISTNPGESFKAPRKTRSAHQISRPLSDGNPVQPAYPIHHARSISSPPYRPITPVQEEPADADCGGVCKSLKALTLRGSDTDDRKVGLGRGMPCPDEESNPFLMPQRPSRLPQASPTRPPPPPVQTPSRPTSSTPRTAARSKRYLNRFTNDQCPDFYDDRMELMERQFSAFKEKMETDMQKATDQKENIQQLQGRGMFHLNCSSLKQLPTGL
jgi:kinesin family protein C1